VNPVVRRLLRSPAHRLISGSVLLLAYTDRRSGVRGELPAGYARLGDSFVVVTRQPARRPGGATPPAASETVTVTVTVAGQAGSCHARLVEPRTAEHQLSLDAYRTRYPRVPVDDATPALVLTPVRSQDPDRAVCRRADELEEHR
jgi:hypothetical protein